MKAKEAITLLAYSIALTSTILVLVTLFQVWNTGELKILEPNPTVLQVEISLLVFGIPLFIYALLLEVKSIAHRKRAEKDYDPPSIKHITRNIIIIISTVTLISVLFFMLEDCSEKSFKLMHANRVLSRNLINNNIECFQVYESINMSDVECKCSLKSES